MVARRLITALIMAVVVSGVFTFWLSKKYAGTHTAAAVTKLQYVATARNMDAGEVIGAADVKMVDWPSGTPLEGAFLKPQDLAGRTLLYPLSTDEPILDKQLAAAGAGAGLSAKIPDGMRAISLRSDEVVGVAGFLLPGTHVDVLVTYHVANSPAPITSMVLQDVEILAAGQKMQPDPDGKPNTTSVVTLLVKPEDAEKVVLASAQGTVHFVLRNGSDHEHVAETSAHGAFGEEPPPSRPAPVHVERREPAHVALAKPYTVQTVNGDKQTVESFQ
jgi:pilus assembly protein CpaB